MSEPENDESIHLQIHVSSHYADERDDEDAGKSTLMWVDVPKPPTYVTSEELDHWGDEQLYPFTGTGRTDRVGSYYEVRIVWSPDDVLTGRQWGWGD